MYTKAAVNKASETGRKNHSRQAGFTPKNIENPFAQGSFRWVSIGEYKTGVRSGQSCVGKFFKTGSVYESSYYNSDIKVTDKAVDLVSLWNSEGIVDKIVQVNVPEVWTFDKSCHAKFSNTKLLIEPYVPNFQKFNSNSGWSDTSFNWGEAMQALSHFSYHISDGKYLLCDLQGGIDDKGITLTDPVIISDGQTEEYGPTDLGPSGISNFFAHHKCNGFCRRHWIQPKQQEILHKMRKGTTMVRPQDSRQQSQQQNRGAPGQRSAARPSDQRITFSKPVRRTVSGKRSAVPPNGAKSNTYCSTDEWSKPVRRTVSGKRSGVPPSPTQSNQNCSTELLKPVRRTVSGNRSAVQPSAPQSTQYCTTDELSKPVRRTVSGKRSPPKAPQSAQYCSTGPVRRTVSGNRSAIQPIASQTTQHSSTELSKPVKKTVSGTRSAVQPRAPKGTDYCPPDRRTVSSNRSAGPSSATQTTQYCSPNGRTVSSNRSAGPSSATQKTQHCSPDGKAVSSNLSAGPSSATQKTQYCSPDPPSSERTRTVSGNRSTASPGDLQSKQHCSPVRRAGSGNRRATCVMFEDNSYR